MNMNFIKKTSLLLVFTTAFTGCEKEETTKHNIDCNEFGVEKTELSCKSYKFTSNVKGTNPNPDWYVYTNPDPNPMHYGNDSNAFEFNPTEPGNYTVEAVYKSDLCSEPVTKGFDVDVEEDCFDNIGTDCNEFGVEKTEHSCKSFTFTANVDKAYMKVDGELIANGQKGFDFDPEHPGTYTVQVGFESPHCPDGAFKEFVVDVDEDCFDNIGTDCNEFGVEKTEHSCKSFTFTANVDKAYMKVNGELIAHGQKGFDFDPEHAGTYTVQVGFESPHCPDGAFKEFVIDVEEDCFKDDDEFNCESFSVEKTQHSCNSFTFTTNAPNPTTDIRVNGEIVNSSKKAYDWDPKEPGEYEIKIGYEGEGCPMGTSRNFFIDVSEDCFK